MESGFPGKVWENPSALSERHTLFSAFLPRSPISILHLAKPESKITGKHLCPIHQLKNYLYSRKTNPNNKKTKCLHCKNPNLALDQPGPVLAHWRPSNSHELQLEIFGRQPLGPTN
jgi:hypothetical protein